MAKWAEGIMPVFNESVPISLKIASSWSLKSDVLVGLTDVTPFVFCAVRHVWQCSTIQGAILAGV